MVTVTRILLWTGGLNICEDKVLTTSASQQERTKFICICTLLAIGNMIVEERGEQVENGRNNTVLNKSRIEETKSVMLFSVAAKMGTNLQIATF